MLLAICLILIAWIVEMPLWLSLLTTVLSGITVIVKIAGAVMNAMKKWVKDNEK